MWEVPVWKGAFAVGTSTKWSGPTGKGWASLRRNIGQLGRGTGPATSAQEIPAPREGTADVMPPETVAKCGRRFEEALREELLRDSSVLGLRPAMRAAGDRLVELLSDLRVGLDVFGSPPTEWTGSNTDWFLYEFVRTVAGEDAGLVDALIRRSATRCAEKVLADPRVKEAIEKADPLSGLAMDLFCMVYTFFFADVVTEFAKAAVSEQVKLAIPGLMVVDPGGQIADWVGERVASRIPNPCEHGRGQDDGGRLINEVAADIVWDNVDRALGLANGAGS